MGSNEGTAPVCSPVPELSGVFSGPCMGHRNVPLKQTTRYFSSKHGFTGEQQRTAIQGLQPWQDTCKSLNGKGKRTLLKKEKERLGAIVNKGSLAFHWLGPWQEGRGVSVLPAGLCFFCWAWEPPSLWASNFYLTEVSVDSFFYNHCWIFTILYVFYQEEVIRRNKQ